MRYHFCFANFLKKVITVVAATVIVVYHYGDLIIFTVNIIIISYIVFILFSLTLLWTPLSLVFLSLSSLLLSSIHYLSLRVFSLLFSNVVIILSLSRFLLAFKKNPRLFLTIILTFTIDNNTTTIKGKQHQHHYTASLCSQFATSTNLWPLMTSLDLWHESASSDLSADK